MRTLRASVLAVLAFAACANTDGTVLATGANCQIEPDKEPTDPHTGQPYYPFADGGVGAGMPCRRGSECAPTCCTCSMKPNDRFLAGECVNGSCATAQTACTDEERYFAGQGFASAICP
jgi:hypothetical protein